MDDGKGNSEWETDRRKDREKKEKEERLRWNLESHITSVPSFHSVQFNSRNSMPLSPTIS